MPRRSFHRRANHPRATTRFIALLGVIALWCVIVPAAWSEITVTVLDPPPPPRFIAPDVDFFVAAAKGDLEALRSCLNEGIQVDAPVPQPVPDALTAIFPTHSRGGLLLRDTGATALMLATAANQPEAMALLLAAKANREARTHSDVRPLDIAAERSDTAAMQLLLGVTPQSDAGRLAIVVDLHAQQATLSRDGIPVLSTRVSSGKKEKPTPPGTYVVTQKYTEWHSTLYHNASMPFFLRLSCSPVGLHGGVVPDYPASHGCVRLPPDTAKKLYDMVPRGTLVTIR